MGRAARVSRFRQEDRRRRGGQRWHGGRRHRGLQGGRRQSGAARYRQRRHHRGPAAHHRWRPVQHHLEALGGRRRRRRRHRRGKLLSGEAPKADETLFGTPTQAVHPRCSITAKNLKAEIVDKDDQRQTDRACSRALHGPLRRGLQERSASRPESLWRSMPFRLKAPGISRVSSMGIPKRAGWIRQTLTRKPSSLPGRRNATSGKVVIP